MLLIWSQVNESKVYTSLAPILAQKPCPVKLVQTLQQVQLMAPNAGAILAMGNDVLKELQSLSLVPKGRTVTSLRTKQIPWLKPTLLTFSPSIGEVEYKQRVDMLTDVMLAFRLAATGKMEPELGDYKWVPDLSQLIAEIKTLLETQPYVDLYFDSETVGLDYVASDKHIVSLQFCIEPGKAHALYFDGLKASTDWLLDFTNQEHLSWLLNHPRIKTSAANGKYDLLWIFSKTGIECSNYAFDTTLVGSLLDENRSNGLDVHAKIYTPIGGYSDAFDRTIDKSRMDLVPKDILLPYAAGDADAGLRVKIAQKEALLKDPELTRFYVNILHPAARAFERIERGGVAVDLQAYKELEADLKVEINSCITRAKKVLGGHLLAKHGDDSKEGGLNLTKAALLTDFMFTKAGLNLKPKMMTAKSTPEKPVVSTAMEHLEMFSNVAEAKEFISILSAYSSATKTLGTYVTGFLEHLREDNRFHASHFLFVGDRDAGEGGTSTGRISVKNPALQTAPKHTTWGKRLRNCLVAPPGMLVAECDYSQGELKVIACLANEEAMIESYRNNLDLHVATSGFVAGLNYAEMMDLKKADKEKYDALRQLGKAGNFGLIYGMGVDGFIEYARVQYGVTLTYAEAESFRTGFFQRYPALLTYHAVYKNFAKKHGYVRSPLGRVRNLPLIQSAFQEIRAQNERRAINAPVQGTLSDMMLWAIALQGQRYGYNICQPVTAIHDAGYYYVPEDHAEMWAGRIVDTMSTLPFERVGWSPQLTFTADAKIGPSFGNLKEVKF